MALRNK